MVNKTGRENKKCRGSGPDPPTIDCEIVPRKYKNPRRHVKCFENLKITIPMVAGTRATGPMNRSPSGTRGPPGPVIVVPTDERPVAPTAQQLLDQPPTDPGPKSRSNESSESQKTSKEIADNRLFMTNKACNVTPRRDDFAQKTSGFKRPDQDQATHLISENRLFMTSKACNVYPVREDFAQKTSGLKRPEQDHATNETSEITDNRLFMTNKACDVTPAYEDFTQKTSSFRTPDQDQYQSLLLEQYGFEPNAKEHITSLKRIMYDMFPQSPKVDNSSQYACPEQGTFQISGSPWYFAENPEEIEELLKHEKKIPLYTSKNVQISDSPRVKVVAEKFTRYKKNNVELRKLEEKIVCVEYDVFERNIGGIPKNKPVQIMRAYFSIKTSCPKCEGGSKLLKEIPTKLKDQLNINEEDVKNFNEQEIEIIDSKISENKPYLDDLSRVLKKKKALIMKRNKTSLDLFSLYDMARREGPPLDYDFSSTNLLSKAELQEIKGLILEKCESNAQGICRKTVKNIDHNECDSERSDCVFHALLRGT